MAGQVYWGLNTYRSNPEIIGDPTILLLGDSWFWYPANNLASELAAQLDGEHRLLVLGRNGAEAQEWSTKYKKELDLALNWYGGNAQALLLSGGGNDIAGSEDFGPIIEDNCSKKSSVNECYSPGQPAAILSRIQAAYREVIATFRRYNTTAPVFCHNYEKAWPSGKGVFGPAKWLKAPMDEAKVPKKFRHDLFVDLLEQLNASQEELAEPSEKLAPIVAIKTTGTLSDTEDIWANELHLKPKQFSAMVTKAWIPALKLAGVS